MAMINALHRFNTQSKNSGIQMDFKLRIGIAIGPVIAGGIPLILEFNSHLIQKLFE